MRRAVSYLAISVVLLALTVGGCKNPLLSGGILHFDQGRFERARETLIEAIEQEPENAEAHFWLGKTYAELDSTQLAREFLDKAAELGVARLPEMAADVDNALEHYWSANHNEGLSAATAAQKAKAEGNTEEEQRNFRLALNKFKRARVYGPDKEETPRNMGAVYFNLGEVDSGLVALKESRRLAGPGDERAAGLLFDQYRFLGDQAAANRALPDAIRFYSEAEALRPDDADLLFSLGVVHYQLAEEDTANAETHMTGAVKYFEKTLEVNPDDQEALYNAASLHLELDGCDKGLAQARQLLDLDPRQGRYYDLVGRLSDCLGEKSERVAGLVFSRALRSGDVVPSEGFEEHRGTYGPTSDLVRKHREEGAPEEVRVFTDATGGEYATWFYWSRGKAFAFYNGEKKYETSFRPQRQTEESGTGSQQ
jgi:tetratricopeptide (TPR) repeat protein